MFKSMKYVWNENIKNFYRTQSISKYELLADMRDSKLGIFWNFANPFIQVMTYYFVFGLVFEKKAVNGIAYMPWMLGGMVIWFFISPCITDGCNAVFTKLNVITKMKFPVSILPATVSLKQLFNHACLMIIVVIVFAFYGWYPSLHWLGLIYYCFCAVIFSICLSLTTSVLNMLARDTRKLILAIMRLLLYLTPILWSIDNVKKWPFIHKLMSANPIYYLVQGYRDCFFFHRGFLYYWKAGLCFWIITLILFAVGSFMMYKLKKKFVDLM